MVDPGDPDLNFEAPLESVLGARGLGLLACLPAAGVLPRSRPAPSCLGAVLLLLRVARVQDSGRSLLC